MTSEHMNTEQMIDSLAEGLVPVKARAVERRLSVLAAGGLALSVLIFMLTLGVQPVFERALTTPVPYLKEFYTMALVTAGFWLMRNAATPGRRTLNPALVVVSIVALALAISAIQLAGAESSAIPSLLLGVSWMTCTPSILMLSLPLLATLMLAVRGLAPTHLRIAGCGAGLCAGALAASVYAFHCIEFSPAFVTLWYTLGIALTAAVGAVMGPWLLRW